MAGGSSTLIYPDAVTLVRARPDDPVTVSVGNDTLRYGTTSTNLSSSLAAGQTVLFTSDRYVKTDADGAVLLVTADPWDRPENVELGELSAETIAAIAEQVEVPYSVLNLTGNPEAVTDWGAIINTAMAAGERQFFFPAGEYPFTTQITTTGYASVRFEGEGGRVDHYGNVMGLERMPSYLLWKGDDSTSAILGDGSVGFVAKHMGIYYDDSDFDGVLIDWDDECPQCILDSCDIGSLDDELTSALALVQLENSWNSTIQNCNLRGAQWAIMGDPTGGNFADSLRILNNFFANCSEAYIGAISAKTVGGGPNWETPRVIDMPDTVSPNLTSYFTFTDNTVLDDDDTAEPWFRQKANNNWYATFSGNTISRASDNGVFELLGGGVINIVNNPNLGTCQTSAGWIVDLGDVTGTAVEKSVTIKGNHWSSQAEAVINQEGHRFLDIQSENQDTYSLDVHTVTGHEKMARYNDASEPYPTITPEANLGSGGSATITGSDTAGFIQLTHGSGGSAGLQATITLGTPMVELEGQIGRLHVILTPMDWGGSGLGSPAADVGAWVNVADGDTSEWELHTARTASGDARFAYRVLGT
jgi:hypothetical protein